ncbi:hypothetical protein [Mucilaginibacter phyllosphaerae]
MPTFPTSEPDAHHDYAHSVALNKDIHITEVTERGRKGYLCIGCQREMQAVLPQVQNRRRYFRHDPKFVKPGDKCTFKDEEYRRKLAIETLELNKEIRVPPVYKYPPKGEAGLALFLLPGTWVSAARVEKHKYFYEGANGSVESAFTYNGPSEELLFKADVVFYDENDEPILFILLGKRKKLTINEFAGLKRLRVNTISLTIPKESAAAIEISQKKGDRAKWLYHDDEQQIAYFSVPADLGEGIPAIDGDPDRLSEESYDCRKVQVNNLIRALGRCLESEPYRTAERAVLTAIGTTELAIKRAGERRTEFEGRYRSDADTAHRGELDEINQRGVRLRTAKAGLNRDYQNLEGRYRSTKQRIGEAKAVLEADIRQEEIALGGTGRTVEELQRDLDLEHQRTRNRVAQQVGERLESIEREQGGMERELTSAGIAVERLRRDIAGSSADLDAKCHNQRKHFDRLEGAEKEAIGGFEKERDGRQGNLEAARAQLTARFDELRRQADGTAEKRDTDSTTSLSRRLKAFLDAGRLVLAIEDAKADQRRLRKAKDFIGTAAFQTWLLQRQRG